MKAVVQDRYGGPDVLRVEEVPVPSPRRGELLVRVAASVVTSGDARIRAFDLPAVFRLPGRLALGITGPRQRVPGIVSAGTVQAVGAGVELAASGDRLLAMQIGGAHAERRVLKAKAAMATIPDALGFEAAAALAFGGHTALHFLRKAEVGEGTRLLVVGASGEVGAMTVQVARARGARVDAVCSAGNAALVRDLGAERTFDYATEDFAAAGRTWDVVMDCVEATTFAAARPALAPDGRFVALVGGARVIWQALRSPKGGQRVIAGTAAERSEDLAELMALAVGGRIRPVIDSTYALADVRAAHARVDTRRKRGAVLLRIADGAG